MVIDKGCPEHCMIGALKLRPSSYSVKDSNIGQVWRVGWKVEGSNRAAGIGFFFLEVSVKYNLSFLISICSSFHARDVIFD